MDAKSPQHAVSKSVTSDTPPHHEKKHNAQPKWYKQRNWIIVLLILFWPVGLFLMWNYTNWSKKAKIIVSTLAVLSLIITFIAAANAPPTIAVDNLIDNKIDTDSTTYTVTGQATMADTVTVNQKKAALNNNNFSVAIDLNKGDNTITISASKGNTSSSMQFVIHRATDAEVQARNAEAAKKAAEDAAKAQADAAAKAASDAAAAAAAVIANAPAEYKSALNQANSYANDQYMSKQGVYDQLVSQYGGQFTAAAAQFAIDHVTADWNANALEKAKQYQSQQSLSPAAIHDQLTSSYGEKFTTAEADYAIQHLNN